MKQILFSPKVGKSEKSGSREDRRQKVRKTEGREDWKTEGIKDSKRQPGDNSGSTYLTIRVSKDCYTQPVALNFHGNYLQGLPGG